MFLGILFILFISLFGESKCQTNEIRANIHRDAGKIWQTYAKILQNGTDAFLDANLPRIMEIVYSTEISPECLITLTSVLSAAKTGSSWFYRMLDASGRPFPAGTTDGSITDLGSYDQCLTIQADEVKGQYCLMRWSPPLPPPPNEPATSYKHLNLQSRVFNFTGTDLAGSFIDDIAGYAHALYDRYGRFGFCTPSTCSIDDLQQLVDVVAKDTSIYAKIAYCETASPIQLTTTQIALLCIIFFILFIVIIATIVHFILERRRKNCSNNNKGEKSGKEHSQNEQDKEESFMVQLVMAISSLANIRTLISMEEKSGSISAIHGIRVISMIWIILTHTYLVPIKESFSFARYFLYVVEGAPFQLIVNGWVLVDTFFFLGAMLATSSLLSSLKKSQGKLDIGQIIANRISRLTPNMWFTIALITIIPSIGSGPMWQEYFNGQAKRCQNYWWATMFYFNNWMPESKLCLLHTWYLSADMQMFLISLIFVPLFYWKPRIGFIATLSALVASVITNAILTYINNLPPTVIYNTPSEADVMYQAESVYLPTYTHAGPYAVGILFGFLFHWDLFNHSKDGNNTAGYKKNKINPWLNMILWFTSIVTALVILLYTLGWNRGQPWNSVSAIIYASLHRTLWATFVGWVVYACATGNGGPTNSILSCKLFIPLSRLSYMGYLMHFLVLWMRYAYLRVTLPFSHYTLFCEFLVNVTMSTFVAAIAYLLIEAPIANIYKLLMGNRKSMITITITRKCSKDEGIKEIDLVSECTRF